MPRLTKVGIPDIIENREGLYPGNLTHYFVAVFTKARNLTNPYHNFRHLFHVLWMCYDAARYYRSQVSPLEIRALLIASIFHDFDHSGRVGQDDLEIERAIRGLIANLAPEDGALLPLIKRLIQATEYPYKVPSEELTLLEQILRDADMSQTFSDVWIQQSLFGLSAELGMSPLQMLTTQEGFLLSLQFTTEWANKAITPLKIKRRIDEVRRLVALLVPSEPL